MKTLFYLLLFTFMLNSCDPDIAMEPMEPDATAVQVLSFDYMKNQNHVDFEIIYLDSLRGYGDLTRVMQRLSCANKRIGIQFIVGDTLHGITGFAECPNDGIISCYFNRNIFIIKNDSLNNRRRFPQDKSLHISELETEIERMRTEEFRYAFRSKVLAPALLHLYIDPKQPNSLTIEVLKEILIAFKEVNSEMGPDFFKYNIIFETVSLMDIPLPPPPTDTPFVME